MRYRISVFLTALILLSAFACACTGGMAKNEGTRLSGNVARIYEREARTSHFAIDGDILPDEVKGMAYMSTSADGETSLAWVNSTLYFVSEKGVDKLGSGIETAEISFDGRIAVWQDGQSVYRYTLEDRGIKEILTGVERLIQLSISPDSSTMLCTVLPEGAAEGQYVTTIFEGDTSRELSRSMICFAVSNDASIMYYYDMETRAFTVRSGDEVYAISKNCSATTNYNFTRDLSEVTYDDVSGLNHLFCLDTKADTTLGRGFGVTEKTDVFSISTITVFTYINDVTSFRGGLWSERHTEDERTYYDIGYINSAGEISWLAKDAVQYKTSPDQSKVIYIDPFKKLVEVKALGSKTKTLANDAASFDMSGDIIYYVSAANSLFALKGSSAAKKVAGQVKSYAALNGVCAFITEDGSLHYAEYTKVSDVAGVSSAVRFDKRASMLILYANESEYADGTAIYDAYLSKDAKTFTLAFNGVEP